MGWGDRKSIRRPLKIYIYPYMYSTLHYLHKHLIEVFDLEKPVGWFHNDKLTNVYYWYGKPDFYKVYN